VALIFVTGKLSAQGVTQSVVTIRTEVSYVFILEIYRTQKSVCKATKTLRKHHLVTLNVNIRRAGLKLNTKQKQCASEKESALIMTRRRERC